MPGATATVAVATAALFLAAAVYLELDPGGFGPMAAFPGFDAHPIDMAPWSEVPPDTDTADSLRKSEIRFLGQVQGPESLAFDAQGRGPYTGVADGRIVVWDGEAWRDFAYTSPNRSQICDPSPRKSYLQNEHICGRPLGIRFDRRTGDLYIADAYFGLLKVGPKGGLATQIAREAEGVPFKFTNDLDIDEDGNIYFTDSSALYQRRNFMQLVFTAEPSGRLLKYSPITKKATVLVSGLQFPNGVSLSKDGSFFVFCEGSRGRLTRYWLKGDKADTTDLFATLPGFPDNVRTNRDGDFWVAIHCRRSFFSYHSSFYPRLRKLLLKLPIPPRTFFKLQTGGKSHGIIVKYGPQGNLLKVLEDRDGQVVRAVSEVEDRGGELWLGSVLMPFIAVYKDSS